MAPTVECGVAAALRHAVEALKRRLSLELSLTFTTVPFKAEIGLTKNVKSLYSIVNPCDCIAPELSHSPYGRSSAVEPLVRKTR